MTLHDVEHVVIPTAWLDGVPVTAMGGRAPRPPPALVACERAAL